MLDPKQVGDLIQQRRKELGLTQEQLGSQLNVTGQAVSKWEQGASLPDTSLLPGICRTIGVSGNALLGLEEPRSTQNILIDINDEIADVISEKIVDRIKSKMRKGGKYSRIENMAATLSLFVGITLVLRLITLGAPLSAFLFTVGGAALIFIVVAIFSRP